MLKSIHIRMFLLYGVAILSLQWWPTGQSYTVSAQEHMQPQDGRIVVKVVPESQEHRQFLPLHTWIELRNEGPGRDTAVISLPVIMQYAYDPGGPWRPYSAFGAVRVAPTPPYEVVLEPMEARRWPVIIDFDTDVRGNARHVFADAPADVFLRAHIHGMVSEPVVVEVKRPDENDAGALDFLQQHPSLAWAFSERVKSAYYQDHVDMNDVRRFIDRFDSTLYAFYARLGNALLMLKSDDEEARQTGIRELLSLGENGPPKLRARSLWYAAQTMTVDSENWKQTMEMARQALDDEYFLVLVSEPLDQR